MPKYAFFSVVRIAIAYFLSLAFTLVYGYVAAYNAKAERIHGSASGYPAIHSRPQLPPPVMLAMIALFPHSQLGVELGCIVLILTGQVWNMTFSFYSSLKSIPRDMHEAAEIYRLSWWQRLWQMELPYAAIGLIWNSIMSVAGAWFFLMACEMFVLGNRDLRLPGLGSYLQTAANAGDTRSIVWGLGSHGGDYRADRPVRLAPHYRLGGEIQIRASRGRRTHALAHPGSPAPLETHPARRAGDRPAGA